MPRICSVCTHPRRDAIDRMIVSGESAKKIAALSRVSDDAIARHRESHLPTALLNAHAVNEAARADDLKREVRDLHTKTLAILARAEKSGDLRTALAAIREASRCLEIISKLAAQPAVPAQPVDLASSPEWKRLREKILHAVEPYPPARAAVAKALENAEP